MTLDAFRDKLMSNSKYEFRVEVNQRCLIDKMLARYSSEFTVFRELLQNSDDATASEVKIVFMGKIGKTCSRIFYKNNGFPFRQQDWDRLKKIAEGNPDEQKIGAFGVGFYSVFSICEEPFVSSGEFGMTFFWKGDQLLVRHGSDSSISSISNDSNWTTFLLDMTKPIKFPDLDKFGHFLTTALGFTPHLRKISIYFNEDCVFRISKEISQPRLIEIRSDLNKESPERMFKLESVNVHSVKFDTFKIDIPPGTVSLSNCRNKNSSVSIKIASGNLKVQIQDEFSVEMERLTKKKPPRETTIQIILPGYNDLGSHESVYDMELLPYPEQGKVFIGFKTHQTTGYSIHLAARVIPTVERESIDLAQKTLSEYNTEMLSSAGILCRLLYEDEMKQISQLYQNESNDKVVLEKRAAHALNYFTFKQSTPDVKVGNIIETNFYKCCSSSLSILSTHGVKEIKMVRLLSSEMASFVKNVPSVPKIMEDQCAEFFNRAKTILKIIEEASLNDVFDELTKRNLDHEEIISLMEWWIVRKFSTTDRDKLMQLAIVRVENKIVHLKNIRYFLNPGMINEGLDVPSDVLPYVISKCFNSRLNKFKQSFRNWTKLSLLTWTKYIIENHTLKDEPDFAMEFMSVLSRAFKNTKKDRFEVCNLLSQVECIPTQFGVKRPDKTYLPEVKLFMELPTVQIKGNDEFFIEMKVHKYVELDYVFARLVNKENLDHIKLLKYFANEDLKNADIERLKTAEIWIKECVGDNKSNTNVQRYKARDLYVPHKSNKELELPVIQWEKRWDKNSDIAKFIIRLGLQEYPSLQTILNLAATNRSLNLREKALSYFINNFREKYSKTYIPSSIQEKFLPCIGVGIYAKPSECYSNPDCAKMGFNVLRQDLEIHAKALGVIQNPYRSLLLNILQRNPPNNDDAKRIFGYLSSCTGDFTPSDLRKLQTINFIPVQDKATPYRYIHYKPKNYMFPCVDFGEDANKFLVNCGVKKEPSALDLAEYLVEYSEKFWSMLNDKEQYYTILGTIAYNIGSINNAIINKMKQKKILVGMKKNLKTMEDIYNLYYAREIFINDSEKYRNMFNPITCPFDNSIEAFYKKLGCKTLKGDVTVTSQHSGRERTTDYSDYVKHKIKERIPWYYSGMTSGDQKWVQRLEVKEVDQINMHYKLISKNEIKSVKASACMSDIKDPLILYIINTNNNDDANFLDIASALARHIHQRENRQESVDILFYLTSSLEKLQALDYPIKNIKITPNNILPIAPGIIPNNILLVAPGILPNNIPNNILPNNIPPVRLPTTKLVTGPPISLSDDELEN
ncbi:9553_t:CDS:10, partial [Scutellospora calospora]